MIDRILHVLTSSETWTNITAFVVGWALAELRAWVAGRMRLRRWRRQAQRVWDESLTPAGETWRDNLVASIERDREARGIRSLSDALLRWNPYIGADEPTYVPVSVAERDAFLRKLVSDQQAEIEHRLCEIPGDLTASPDHKEGE